MFPRIAILFLANRNRRTTSLFIYCDPYRNYVPCHDLFLYASFKVDTNYSISFPWSFSDPLPSCCSCHANRRFKLSKSLKKEIDKEIEESKIKIRWSEEAECSKYWWESTCREFRWEQRYSCAYTFNALNEWKLE